MASGFYGWKICFLLAAPWNFAGNFRVEARLVVSKTSHEPMVAFTCNLPAMHMTDQGWKKDEKTDCLQEPNAILEYCRKMYPGLDVRNVVEASTSVNIKDWCSVGRTRCHHHSFTVRPYRCLVGPFQSDALLVPRSCLFDHIHDPRSCQTYDAWNKSAVVACQGRGLVQQSFAIIQPCSVDRFSGAEFVCCPASADITKEDHEDQDERTFDRLGPPKFESLKDFKEYIEMTTAPVTSSSPEDAYVRYMQNTLNETNKTEHETYKQARADLDRRHHQRVTKMMKDWTEAHQRVREMQAIDAKGAEKLNKQITARFQKMYDSLEEENEAENKQLRAVHQQRIQTELNEMKRKAMEAYMAALAEPKPSSIKVMKALKHYIKVEQKDRVHMITHYQRLQQSDPVEAEAIFSYVADHLRVIDQRLTQALDMLNRLPKQEKKIRAHIEDFLSTYHSLDESLAVILAKMAEQTTTTTSTTTTATATTTTTTTTTQSRATPTIPSSSTSTVHAVEDKTTEKIAASKSSSAAAAAGKSSDRPLVNRAPVPLTRPVEPLGLESNFDRFDEGVMEGHDDYIQIRQAGHVAHFDNSQLELETGGLRKLNGRTDTGMYLATPLGIAVCSIALVVIIAVGIAVLRKRVYNDKSTTDDLMYGSTIPTLPRTAKVKPSQMNGYENPTHKYLEENNAPVA